MATDYVGEFIALKEQKKELDEKLKALELVILNEHRDDDRIKIISPRKTMTLKESVYEKLEQIGITPYVTEQRPKKLEELDVDVQEVLMDNEDNFTIKYSKESIRVK